MRRASEMKTRRITGVRPAAQNFAFLATTPPPKTQRLRKDCVICAHIHPFPGRRMCHKGGRPHHIEEGYVETNICCRSWSKGFVVAAGVDVPFVPIFRFSVWVVPSRHFIFCT